MLLGQVASAPKAFRILLPLLAYLLTVSLAVFSAGIFFAEQSRRSLKHLLILTAMIALSLALFSNWKRISWEGRRYWMSGRIAAIQSINDSLQKDWPTNDMNHELLGPVMAYPQWHPTTLLLLTPMPIDNHFCLAAIDRSSEEVMRFELSSGYETIWLEHRVANQLDSEFTNGISQKFTRQYYVSISPGWYLVRYQ